MNTTKKAFITGATGLVGSHVLIRLLLEGFAVKALYRSNPNLQKLQDISKFYSSSLNELLETVEWIEGDINDYYSLIDAIDEGTTVFHCAAFVSFNHSDRHRLKQVNEEGTANMVDAAIEKKAGKFIFISTIGTLGTPEKGHLTDENCAWQAKHRHSAYSQSKFRGEMEVWRGTKEGLNAIIINPSVILGPCDINQSTGKLFKLIASQPKFYTTGSTGYVDVRDVANACVCLVNSDIVNERFILNGANIPFNEFMTLTANSLNLKPPTIEANELMTSIAWRLEWLKSLISCTQPSLTRDSARIAHSESAYSSEKFIQATNYQFNPIEQTISETAEWMLTYQKDLMK